MPTPVSLSTLLAKMTAIFAKADPEAIADLNDALDVPVASDIWNGTPAPVPTSPAEAMDGATGAARMTGHYSEKTPNDSTPHADLAKRLDSLEKAVRALMAYTVKADLTDEESERFPNSETAKSDDKEDKSDDDDDDDSDVSKSIATMDVKDVMSFLTRRLTKKAKLAVKEAEAKARLSQTYMSVSMPPDMNRAAIQKAGPSLRAICEERINDGGLSMGEGIQWRRLHSAVGMAERGVPGAAEQVAVLRGQLGVSNI